MVCLVSVCVIVDLFKSLKLSTRITILAADCQALSISGPRDLLNLKSYVGVMKKSHKKYLSAKLLFFPLKSNLKKCFLELLREMDILLVLVGNKKWQQSSVCCLPLSAVQDWSQFDAGISSKRKKKVHLCHFLSSPCQLFLVM